MANNKKIDNCLEFGSGLAAGAAVPALLYALEGEWSFYVPSAFACLALLGLWAIAYRLKTRT